MRLFVAIELSEAVKSDLARLQLGLTGGCLGVRWIESSQLHMTLCFLGDAPNGKVASIANALATAAASLGQFNMQLCGTGSFPPRGPVRIVWIGISEPTRRLHGCADAVRYSMTTLGFAIEAKPFTPHITLGRVSSDGSCGRLRSFIDSATYGPKSQSVSKISLMSSVLSRGGALYHAVARAELAASP